VFHSDNNPIKGKNTHKRNEGCYQPTKNPVEIMNPAKLQLEGTGAFYSGQTILSTVF
jgi:hypothetical protein